MKVAIACGGTGGHIYPALAVAEKLKKRPGVQFCFIAGEEGLEGKIISREGHTVFFVKGRGLLRKFSYQALTAPWVALAGLVQSFFILKRLRPDILLATGGYLSLPVGFAAFCLGIPVVLLEPNAILGFSNRLLLPLVAAVAVAFEATKQRYGNPKLVVTGNPVREKIIGAQKIQAMGQLNLDPGKKTVLVLGGSQGAKSINQLMLEMVPLIQSGDLQVLHVAGSRDFAWVKAALPKDPLPNYQVFDYVFDLSALYAASDLVVSRAGATAIAEILGRGLPSVLIPFPYAAEGHQELNALILKKTGAAEMLLEQGLRADDLYRAVRAILADPQKQDSMRQAALALGKRDAAGAIVDLLFQIKLSREKKLV